jgi:hypothetical protein
LISSGICGGNASSAIRESVQFTCLTVLPISFVQFPAGMMDSRHYSDAAGYLCKSCGPVWAGRLQLVVFYKKMNFFDFILFRYPGVTELIHVAFLPDF